MKDYRHNYREPGVTNHIIITALFSQAWYIKYDAGAYIATISYAGIEHTSIPFQGGT